MDHIQNQFNPIHTKLIFSFRRNVLQKFW
jgi:hypothetical protein